MKRRILLVVLAVLLVDAASVYAMFSRHMARACARARLVGRSKTIQTAVGTLESTTIGEGEPMLIVRGAAGGLVVVDEFMRKESDRLDLVGGRRTAGMEANHRIR